MASLQSFLAVKPAAGWAAPSRRARVAACLAPPPPTTAAAVGAARRELSAASLAVVDGEARYLVGTYKRSRVVFEHGRGCKLYDTDGREYLDMAAGIAVTALGHADPDVCATIAEQAGKVVHVSNVFYTKPQVGAPAPSDPPSPASLAMCSTHCSGRPIFLCFICRSASLSQVELAKRLVEVSFADRAFFASTGTEANEAAIKFSRKFQRAAHPESGDPPTEFLAFSSSFHGRTMGAVALTSKSQYREPFAPVMPGVTFVDYGDLEAAKKFVRSGRVAAVFVEPVQGEGGIHSATREFLQGLRDACDEAGALLVFDEVRCTLSHLSSLNLCSYREPDDIASNSYFVYKARNAHNLVVAMHSTMTLFCIPIFNPATHHGHIP